MPLPVISNVYRVSLNWHHATLGNAVNVLHIQAAAVTSAAVAAAIDANVTANMWAQVSQSAVVTSVQVIRLDGSAGTYTLATSGAKWTGNGGVGDVIPNNAEVISLGTGLRGPAHRGRLYLPFVTEAAQANGSIVGAATTQTAWNAFFTAMTGGAWLLVVASYLHSSAAIVTSITVKPFVATQRRRLDRLKG